MQQCDSCKVIAGIQNTRNTERLQGRPPLPFMIPHASVAVCRDCGMEHLVELDLLSGALRKYAYHKAGRSIVMTRDQRQYFSNEWLYFFETLDQDGYTVEYQDGAIHIRNHENRMRVVLVRGSWMIFLHSPWRSPDSIGLCDDQDARLTIRAWLNVAAYCPVIYSFAGYADVAAAKEALPSELPTPSQMKAAPRRWRTGGSRTKRWLRMMVGGKKRR